MLKLSACILRACVLQAAALIQLSAQSSIRRCGVERWPVKTLADRDSGSVRLDTAFITTIGQLGSIPIPEIPYPNDRRIAPHEHRRYRVTGVITQILTESDGDWHIIIADPANPNATMIAEIPSPECAATEAHRRLYSAARDSLRRIPRRGVAVVEGVGFFDFIHNQRGRARNGIELHPVLSIAPLSAN